MQQIPYIIYFYNSTVFQMEMQSHDTDGTEIPQSEWMSKILLFRLAPAI